MLTSPAIIQRILSNVPVSIIRAGDGEGIVLNATNGYSELRTATDAVLKRQMGYAPTLEDVEAIRNNLIDAYNNCDIIGIPNHKQETSAAWHKVLDTVNRNCPDNKQVHCDIDIAYQWLDGTEYDDLLHNRRVLNYISCRDLEQGFKERFNIKHVNGYHVAPEAKFTSGYTGERHYPEQFSKANRWMDVMLDNHPGSLLMVGAGVIGKLYCNWWRDKGGLAMDIGGVMDLFAGFVTRGPERGMDKEFLKYKL